MEALCVDMGNVIIDHLGFGTTEQFVNEGNYCEIPPVKDVLFFLAKLNAERFKNNVYVIYNATGVADSKIDSWLDCNDFCEITKIERNRIIRSKGGRNKTGFCIEKGISHFIDDRLEVLSYLFNVVPNLFLFRGQNREIKKFKFCLSNVKRLENWSDLYTLLNDSQ